jgi:glycosyltransferase involved in cell wall biosynthesis
MTQISIITPAYIDTPEKGDWLKETIQSVQEQDFTDWEMIVVDDASPLALDIPDDPRVRVVRAAQQSKPSLCRNTAAALARSECLLPLDADDRLAAGALRAMYELWDADRKRVVYGDMQRLEPQDVRGTIPVTAMHSKEAHMRAGGWKEEFDAGLEDVEYWISCGLAGFCGYHIDLVTL